MHTGRSARIKWLLVLVALLALPAASVPGFAAPAAAARKKLTFSITVGVGSLDPLNPQGSSDSIIIDNVFSGLVRHKPGTVTEVDADLAERWTVSADGRVYTFFLRRNARWHDGLGTVTAQDVKYSWDRVRDSRNRAIGADTLSPVESVEAMDQFTARVTLKERYSPFLVNIAHDWGVFIVPQRAVEERGAGFRLRPVGSGPYRVVRAESRGGVVLEAFSEYWEGRPKIDDVEMRVIPEEAVATLALLRQEIDYVVVRDPANIGALKRIEAANRRVTVNSDENFSASMFALWLNLKRKPFDDVRVRRALIHALDRAALTRRVNEGLITRVAHSIVPPSLLGHTESVRRYPYDPALAKRLLIEAGYGGGVTVKALATVTSPFFPPTLTIVQAMWAQVGVRLEPEILERGAVRSRQGNGDYDITLSNPTRSEVDALLQFFHSRNAPPNSNAFTYYNGVDSLIDQQARAATSAERQQIIRAIQQRVAEDVPALPLWYPLETTASRDYVVGHIPNIGWWRAQFWRMDLSR
jgi:peptide/nickel transport system substrate-binding protein